MMRILRQAEAFPHYQRNGATYAPEPEPGEPGSEEWFRERREWQVQQYLERQRQFQQQPEVIHRGVMLSDIGPLPEDQSQWADHILNHIKTSPYGNGGLGEYWATDEGQEAAQKYGAPTELMTEQEAGEIPWKRKLIGLPVPSGLPVMMSGTWNGDEDSSQSHDPDFPGERILGPEVPVTLHSLKAFRNGEWKELLSGPQEHMT